MKSAVKLFVAASVVALGGVAFAQSKTSPGAGPAIVVVETEKGTFCLLYTSPSPRDS